MTCVFAVSSYADGCHVILKSLLGNTSSIFIQKLNNYSHATAYSVVDAGVYIMSVHDVIGGEIIEDIAYSTRYTIIQPYTSGLP